MFQAEANYDSDLLDWRSVCRAFHRGAEFVCPFPKRVNPLVGIAGAREQASATPFRASWEIWAVLGDGASGIPSIEPEAVFACKTLRVAATFVPVRKNLA